MNMKLLLLSIVWVVTLTQATVDGWWSTPSVSSIRTKIANVANNKVGSTHWSRASSCCHGSNTNKCNYFVYDVGREAGAKMPTRSWRRGPIGAGNGGWGKASSLSYWSRVSSPQKGDIVAALNIKYNAYHVGIYVGTDTAVSANSVDVGKNKKMFSSAYRDLVYWRYQG